MMKTYPCKLVSEIVGKSFYYMQKAKAVELDDKADASNYHAFDSMYSNNSGSGHKKSMKKLAVLNIKEHIKMENINSKSVSEKKFFDRHHEFWRTDDNEDNDEKPKEENKEDEDEDKDYKQVIEEYSAHEEKIWDCYQLFCKLINHRYNPYDDEEIEDYLMMQEVEAERGFQEAEHKPHKGLLNSIWPFTS